MRRHASIENDDIRVTVAYGGGHIAEILDKRTGVNPLWVPPWPSIDPSDYDPADLKYGSGAEAKLLSGILGHNLCLDLFGGPSPEEAAAGITVHGEASVVPYEVVKEGDGLTMRASLPIAGLGFERRLELRGRSVQIRETVTNLSALDRPIAWTQHVTLGPPFVERGVTQFRIPATRSKVYEHDFGAADYLVTGAEFDWPNAPNRGGGTVDLQTFTSASVSGAFTTHLLDPAREDGYFTATNLGVTFGYSWKRADFPWIGIWEENHSRTNPPWNGATLTRGMEFGVSPMPESRREMIDRGSLFGVPGYRWLPARYALTVEYAATISPAPKT
jgi:hypothetical protein